MLFFCAGHATGAADVLLREAAPTPMQPHICWWWWYGPLVRATRKSPQVCHRHPRRKGARGYANCLRASPNRKGVLSGGGDALLGAADAAGAGGAGGAADVDVADAADGKEV